MAVQQILNQPIPSGAPTPTILMATETTLSGLKLQAEQLTIITSGINVNTVNLASFAGIVAVTPSGQKDNSRSLSIILSSEQNVLPVSIIPSGQKTSALSQSVVLASDQNPITVGLSGLHSDLRGGKLTLAVEVLDALGNQVTSFGGGSSTSVSTVAITPSGQQAKDKSLSVTIASDQNIIPVSIIPSGQKPSSLSQSVVLSSDHPLLSISGTVVAGFGIVNSLQETNYSLSAAAYSGVTGISNDYMLDHLEFHFSARQNKNISVFDANGTILWSATNDNSLDIVLEDIDKAYNANENITVTVSQTAGTCNMNFLLVTRQGELAPVGSGVTIINALPAGSNTIGRVGINTLGGAQIDPATETTLSGLRDTALALRSDTARIVQPSGQKTSALSQSVVLSSDHANVPVTQSGVRFFVFDGISTSGYDLNAAGFNTITSIPFDYTLDQISFRFSTNQIRTITITGPNNTLIWKDVNNNNLDISLEGIDKSFRLNEQINVVVTQTAGACLMNVLLTAHGWQ